MVARDQRYALKWHLFHSFDEGPPCRDQRNALRCFAPSAIENQQVQKSDEYSILNQGQAKFLKINFKPHFENKRWLVKLVNIIWVEWENAFDHCTSQIV